MRFEDIQKITIFTSKSKSGSPNNSMSQVAESMAVREKDRQYRRLASAVLLRRNIHPETKELSSFLGDCSDRKNVVAVQQWITEIEPDLEYFGREEIEEFSNQLKNHIDDYFMDY